ncbi:MAG: phosphatase PAP2 family protein [Acidobacteria bacterium]|nr:phosphatase PAP2 family protein [Acidobacteriota bacterium]
MPASDAAAGARRFLAAPRPEEWFALGYAALVALLLAAFGLPISIAPMAREYGRFLLAMLAFALPLWLVALGIRAARGRFDRSVALRDLGGLARALPALLVTLIAYTNLKSRIAQLHPTLYDAALERIDATIHFAGGDFVGWLLGFTHEPAASRLWSYVYFYAWAALALPFGLAFARAGATAARRLVAALILTYAAGSLLYLAFPSLGPAFAFRPRFEHLHGTLGFDVQGSMLAAYLRLLRDPHATAVPFFGIAAMPSLHLATTALGLFAAWRWFRPMLLVLVPWNLAIAWSALYFGWHYAVDFYVGVMLAWGAWAVGGRLGRESRAATLSTTPMAEVADGPTRPTPSAVDAGNGFGTTD